MKSDIEARSPGEVIANKYTLLGEIGRGSMGVVYRAKPIVGGVDIALKLMNPAYATDLNAQKRFLREARVAASLTHPAAANVVDFGNIDGTLFIAMTLLDGVPLRVWLDQQQDRLCSIKCLTSIGQQVADVLAAAHRLELIHRDIKPANIFLLNGNGMEPDIRVLDFGLAFLAEHDGSLGRLTQDGVLGGTPAYMSPEQAQADVLTAASDVYSLGCVLYELACGEVPFSGSVPETLARHVYMVAKPLSRRISRSVPQKLSDLIEEMLVKVVTERPTAQMVVDRLRNILV